MRRLALPALCALALVLVAQAAPAPARSGLVTGVPTDLRAFLLRANEPVTHTYSRTPSFSWTPVRQAGGHYQFQIATSLSFQDGTLVFQNLRVPQPALTVPRQLPWITGQPYALWARVRWVSDNARSATKWSRSFGFNIQWTSSEVPKQLAAPEGLVRWTPVDGATAYQVLYPDFEPAQSFETTTNVADEREYFTFHNSLGYGTIHWRVRAIRDVGQFQSSTNGLPAVSYGPWSPVYTTVNSPQTAGKLRPADTVSDVLDRFGKPGTAHVLTPGYAWTPSAPVLTDGSDPGSSLYRVYIFSDKNCVNRIFTGSIVGSPAWAPRSLDTSPTPETLDGNALPPAELDPAKPLAGVDATGATVNPNETVGAQVSANKGSKKSESGSVTAQTSGAPQATDQTQVTPTPETTAGVDLWDSGWPSGRFYWTVVPVTVIPPAQSPGSGSSTGASGSSSTGSSSTGSSASGSSSSGSSSSGSSSSGSSSSGSGSSSSSGTAGPPTGVYQDTEVPQDACQSGAGMSFGKVSQALLTSAGTPFLSGVSPTGRVVAAVGTHAQVFASPIAAWQPVVGATKYQVELSRKLYPWVPTKSVGTPATSVVLPITKFDTGTWYYRVRGINENLPAGARAMDWSNPVGVTVTGSRVAVIRG